MSAARHDFAKEPVYLKDAGLKNDVSIPVYYRLDPEFYYVGPIQ